MKIRYEETALREQARQAGARWDPVRKLWKTTGAVIPRLRLESRTQTRRSP